MHNIDKNLACIELDNVTVKNDREVVLEDVTFKIHAGDYVGIIGPNGGGKTTLLKTILGLIIPSNGEVKIFNSKPSSVPSKYQKVGYVPQHVSTDGVTFPATVKEIVYTGRSPRLKMLEKFSEQDVSAVNKALQITNTSGLQNRLIGELSGGERQRVYIARALASEPQILILDEPTVGVDISSQEQFFGFLAKLNHEQGLTIILVSHDIDVVANEVHKLLCINKKVVYFGESGKGLTAEYIEKLYGKKIKFAFHGH